MTEAQSDAYLRARALRVVSDDTGDYSQLTRTLAEGVLDLLDARARGRHLAEERFDAEMAELRDGLLEVDRKVERVADLCARRVVHNLYREQ